MLPLYALFISRDAVARQFDYDDAFLDDVAPAARPQPWRPHFTLAKRLRRRSGGAVVRPSWNPSH